MRRITVALFVLMMVTGAVLAKAASEETAKKPMTNKKCPVMNTDAKPDIRAEYKGQFVYFCCKGCITMFEKDPETYVAKMSKEEQEAIKANDICPVTNEKITDQTRFLEHDGRKVYFCCDGCANMYKQKMAEKKAA